MKNIIIIAALAVCGLLLAKMDIFSKKEKPLTSKITENEINDKQNVIYFAGGCFWGTEHFFKQVRGVTATEVGYANGNFDKPTYEQVSTGNTGAAETVKVTYDPEIVDLGLLVDLYFKTIDPTSLNQQGNDKGTQYRSGIFYADKNDEKLIREKIKELSKNYFQKIVVECEPLRKFYHAETYHQNYLDKNPGGYCHIEPGLFDMAKNANPPKANDFKKKDQQTLKKELTKTQYDVTQNGATERPYDNEYDKEFREGIYVDITTGEPLFISTDKFEAGCGWPSFSKPISEKLVKETTDNSQGMTRVEVKSKTGDAHLGHVFDDGPKEKGGLRYCINSASLKFIPKDEMKAKGYEKYISLLNKKS